MAFLSGASGLRKSYQGTQSRLGLNSFNVNEFYATKVALGFAMLAHNLMSLFRQAVLRGTVQHALATLHHKVFAVGAFWYKDPDKRQLNWAVSRRRRA